MPELQFGVFLSPRLDTLPGLAERVAAAETAGFDYVSIQDHPYVGDFVDPFVLIAHLAARTERLRFMTNVANLPLRPAPMLAKASASIDQLTDGRFELGLGGGRAWDQIAGLGGPRWTPGETVAAIDAAIDTLRALWTRDRIVDSNGEHYPLHGAASGPPPAHRIGIWLGAAGPRMLDLLGAKADGWIAPMATDFASKAPAQDRIDSAALATGRKPDEIRRVIQLVGFVEGPGASSVSGSATTRPLTGPGSTLIRADTATWARIVAEFVTDERFDTVNLIPASETVDQISRFGGEVIPLARQLIGGSR